MKNYLSTNIKFIRNQKGLTQEQFSELLEKDYSTIGKWENGSRSPIMEDVIKLSEILDLRVEELLFKDLRLKQEPNEHEKNLDEFATKNNVKIFIEGAENMKAEDVLEAQEFLRKIQTGEIEKYRK